MGREHNEVPNAALFVMIKFVFARQYEASVLLIRKHKVNTKTHLLISTMAATASTPHLHDDKS